MVVTPAYTAPSAPVETVWANIKNPIARKQTKNMAELREQVMTQVRSKITEKTWLGAYSTTRQWEDETFVDLDVAGLADDDAAAADVSAAEHEEEEQEADEDA